MKLNLADIADTRAYERTRPEFQKRLFELKRKRRVPVGPIITLMFENRETMRFQVQEMARAERMATDEQIQAELDVYNALIPDAGELSATLFVELTSRRELEEWLPKLVGIERSVQLWLSDGTVIGAAPEDGHADQLTRDDVTASVHYVRFSLTPEQIDRLAAGPASIAVCHPSYSETTALSGDTRSELLTDLRG